VTDKLLGIEVCQAEMQEAFSSRQRPRFLFGPSGLVPWLRRRSVVFVSAARILRNEGFLHLFKKTVALGIVGLRVNLIRVTQQVRKTPATDGMQLNLQPGEWVEVKSFEDIQQTLDSEGKNHGLLFVNKMNLHCGRRYRVFKRVESIFNEFTKEHRKVRNTVLLEGVYCHAEGLGCDRSCFHMWREVWLRRIPARVETANAAHSNSALRR